MKNFEGDGLRPFLLNSIPKSGTHLLKQLLLGIPRMQHNPDKGMFDHYHYQTEIQINRIRELSYNEFVNGHLFYSHDWENFFKSLKMKQIFVIRDPRDVIVSYAHFIPTLKIHPLFDTFHQKEFTHRDRLKFLIEGGQPINLERAPQPDVFNWYTSFTGWIGTESVLTVKYEDLNSTQIKKTETVLKIVQFLWEEEHMPLSESEIVAKMIKNINPSTSLTFRKGKIGSWKEEFDSELIALFKKKSKDLLQTFNYEKDENW